MPGHSTTPGWRGSRTRSSSTSGSPTSRRTSRGSGRWITSTACAPYTYAKVVLSLACVFTLQPLSQAHNEFHRKRAHVLFVDTVQSELPGNADFVAAVKRVRGGWRCAECDRTWLQALTETDFVKDCGVRAFATKCNECVGLRGGGTAEAACKRLRDGDSVAEVLGL